MTYLITMLWPYMVAAFAVGLVLNWRRSDADAE